jgi:hypothetical protein
MTGKYEAVCGGCFCGAVRYEAEVNLHEAYYCHCQACQKLTGSPATVRVLVKPGTLSYTKEEPKFFQSAPFAKSGFCQICCSPIIWVSPEDEEWTNVYVGSLDHPENVVPCEHDCVESQLPWHNLKDDLPRKHSENDPELLEMWEKIGLSHDGKLF